MMTAGRISIITLGVRDMKRSRDYYQRLGWSLDEKQSNENVSFFQGKGIILGLYEHDALAEDASVQGGEPGFRGVSLACNFADEAEVDEAFNHAVSCGAEPIKRPEKVFWGGYSGYVADPDGHLWEFAHNPFFGFDREGHVLLSADNNIGGAA